MCISSDTLCILSNSLFNNLSNKKRWESLNNQRFPPLFIYYIYLLIKHLHLFYTGLRHSKTLLIFTNLLI